MKNFLNKYNATNLETTKDESQLSLEGYKHRILKILDENIINFIAEEKEKAYRRKKECNARRREKQHHMKQRTTMPSENVVTQQSVVFVPRYQTL